MDITSVSQAVTGLFLCSAFTLRMLENDEDETEEEEDIM